MCFQASVTCSPWRPATSSMPGCLPFLISDPLVGDILGGRPQAGSRRDASLRWPRSASAGRALFEDHIAELISPRPISDTHRSTAALRWGARVRLLGGLQTPQIARAF